MVAPCVMEGFEDALHSPEELANHEKYGLVLHPVDYGPTWNGWAQPVVKAKEFAAFVASHAANDKNGTWGSVFLATDQNGRPVLVHVSTDYDGDSITRDVIMSAEQVGTGAMACCRSTIGPPCQHRVVRGGEVLTPDVVQDLDLDDTGIVIDLGTDDWCISAWSPTEGNVYELSGWCFVALPETKEVLG